MAGPTGPDNDRPDPIQDLLDEAEHFLREAVTTQGRDHDPDHGDFYSWGSFLTVVAEQTEQIARALASQIGDYQTGHTLRDDAGMPPVRRIDRVLTELGHLRDDAHRLRGHANTYWSEIGHVGLDLGDEDRGPG